MSAVPFGMRLIVVHHHWRPGGVRRVVEQSLPWIAHPRVSEIVLLSGETPDPVWTASLAARLTETRLVCRVEKAFGYWAEIGMRSGEVRQRVCRVLRRLLAEGDFEKNLVWVHNPGLARNLPMSAALARVCRERQVRVIWHHHDWWYDNRWARWGEIRDSGFRTLAGAARATAAAGGQGVHVSINRADARRLRAGFGRNVFWLPNVLVPVLPPLPTAEAEARLWLERHHRLPRDGPIWLVPCRFLRRKNLLEAVLLTRWLRPEAHLVTTGGPSSRDEFPAWNRMQEASRRNGWNVRFSVLAGADSFAPSVAALMAASEILLLTSVQEGFGLPFLEAAAFRKPLLGRRLPQVLPDLEFLGLRFPHLYRELWISPESLDWSAEVRRQRELWATWARTLPRAARRRVPLPEWLEERQASAVPFGRLTLTGQLEVLAQPTHQTLAGARRLNPWLRPGTPGNVTGRLRTNTGTRQAIQNLSGQAYARRFWRAAATVGPSRGAGPENPGDPDRVLEAFLDSTMAERHWFPMLWFPET